MAKNFPFQSEQNIIMSHLPTYFVVCLHESCTQEAAQYISDRLVLPKPEGGAGLVVVQEAPMRKNGLIIHVSATEDRLLQLAEDIGVKKPDKQNVVRDLTVSNVRSFPSTGLVGPLTLSDVHRCVLHAMESLHFPTTQQALPGHPLRKVMEQAPILSAYREAGLIDTFPLHDDEALGKLHAAWKAGSLFDPPIEQIRDYFGENLALYFSFASFYTAFLVPVAAVGLFQLFVDKVLGVDIIYSNLFFALLNMVSVTVFLELWKRRSNEHNYKWGTAGKLRHKRPRPEFRGELGVNKITGREEMQYPVKKTVQKMVFVSIPITLACLLGAFFLMLGSFHADFVLMDYFTLETGELDSSMLATGIMLIPTIVYSVLILVMNQYYLHLAHHLTEWENHRTQEQFERYVVAKLILFEFVNTFLALFYIAFYLQDIKMLKSQVLMMLIVQQIVNQLQETVLPIVLKRPSTRRVMKKISKRMVDNSYVKIDCKHCAVNKLACLGHDDPHIAVANFSLKKDPYESTYDDFMEIWLQFGHVFLFSSVYPLAGFFALLNNLVELKIDSYKMCRFMRKPTPRAVRDIGAWYLAFSLTSVVSVMTNCALLAMDKDVQAVAPQALERDWILLFVALEHVFLLIRVAIGVLIPDVTVEIKARMDRDDFLMRTNQIQKDDDDMDL